MAPPPITFGTEVLPGTYIRDFPFSAAAVTACLGKSAQHPDRLYTNWTSINLEITRFFTEQYFVSLSTS